MEQLNTWEQPKDVDNVPVADAKIDDSTTSSTQNGSQYGKFKDADSLFSAYNNLQAEFTRKCQRLSELEKLEQEKCAENEKQANEIPVFDEENWQDVVTSFLEKHEDAKQFASEISGYILANPELKNNKNALDIAWANVISQKYKSPEKLISDDKFVEDYVLKDEQIKEKVLSKYLKDIESKKMPPFVTRSSGGNITFETKREATTLSEAKQLVEAMLKN